MSLADAFAPSDNRNYNVVMQDAFGHLAPERRKAIPGWISFVTSPYSGCTVVDFGFEGTESSPWLAEAIADHVAKLSGRYAIDDEAGMFRWQGSVTMFNNGAFRFGGETRRLTATPGTRLRSVRRRH
jgi:hypothetical protein